MQRLSQMRMVEHGAFGVLAVVRQEVDERMLPVAPAGGPPAELGGWDYVKE